MGMEELRFPFPGVRKCLVDADDKYTLQLVCLIVEPSERRKGVGKQVLGFVKELARKRGFRALRLIAMPIGEEEHKIDIIDLRRFYKRNGFVLQRDNETMIHHL